MRRQWIELGQEPQPLSDCPADLEDFPSIIHTAIDIFNNLSDIYIPRMEGNPYYQGKDKSSIDILFRLHYIEDPEEQLTIIGILNVLDARAKKDINRVKK